jgi:hypothetical protein
VRVDLVGSNQLLDYKCFPSVFFGGYSFHSTYEGGAMFFYGSEGDYINTQQRYIAKLHIKKSKVKKINIILSKPFHHLLPWWL